MDEMESRWDCEELEKEERGVFFQQKKMMKEFLTVPPVARATENASVSSGSSEAATARYGTSNDASSSSQSSTEASAHAIDTGSSVDVESYRRIPLMSSGLSLSLQVVCAIALIH